ncbi:MAG TPA: hypothetical protein VF192_01310 [Longimicrobiales bacterium]
MSRVLTPMDPDNTSELTARLGVHNRAHTLLVRHARNYPRQLVSALSTPAHGPATAFLRDRKQAGLREAIEDYARDLRGREAFLDDDDVVEDISVRAPSLGAGAFGDPTYFAVVYRKGKSGRSARAAVPYDAVPEFDRAFTEFERAQEGGAPLAEPVEASGEDREELQRVEAEKASLESQLRELTERLGALENPEPFAGYGELNATDVVKRIKDGGAQEFGTVGLQAIIDYEEKRDNPRKSIVDAAKDAQAEVAER